MKDYFNRELKIGDICYRIQSGRGNQYKPTYCIVKIEAFSEKMVILERGVVVSPSIQYIKNHLKVYSKSLIRAEFIPGEAS